MPGNRILCIQMLNDHPSRFRFAKSNFATTRSRWRKAQLFFALAFLAAGIAAATDSADPTRYLADIKALSAPSMEGRGAGTKGIMLAMHLIEDRYSSLGL